MLANGCGEPDPRNAITQREKRDLRDVEIGATHDAGIGDFGVADDAGFVNVFPGEADFGRCGLWAFRPRTPKFAIGRAGDLTALLRLVVFICEPALRLRLDVESISLRAMRSGDDGVGRTLGLCEPRNASLWLARIP